MHVYFSDMLAVPVDFIFNDVIKMFSFHIIVTRETAYNLNDDGDNYVLMNQPGFYGSWPFLFYFIYYFYLIIHMVATAVVCERLLFTSQILARTTNNF